MLKHLIAAAILYFVDAWVMGQGIWASIPSVIIAIIVLVRPPAQGDPRPWTTKLSKVAVWTAVPIATIGTLVVFANIAHARAQIVVQAVENFHAAEGHYPAKLDELVPTYLAKVPRASPRMSFDKFDYIAVPPGDKPFLMWVVIPPFGRRTYDFEKKQGSSID